MDLLVGGLALSLWPGAFTVRQLNLSVAENATWSSANNFSFVSDSAVARGCHQLGDVSFRARPAGGHGEWTYFSSAARAAGDVAPAVDGGADALAAHDLTGFLSSDPAVGGQAWPPAQFADGSPLRVTRTYARSPGGGPGFVLRFNATNVGAAAVELGALGFAMPDAGVAPDIEQSVWNDPHVGGDHGHVEWVRVVLGEQTMVAGDSAIYFNAICTVSDGARDAAGNASQKVTLSDGRITVKEDIGVNTGIFQARGILAEFKIVGTFGVATPAPPQDP